MNLCKYIQNNDLEFYRKDFNPKNIISLVKLIFGKKDYMIESYKVLIYKKIFNLLKELITIGWDRQFEDLVNILIKEKIFFKDSF